MAVFISYSHADARFVETLAANLFRAKANVWIDRWELNIGDSLVQRIQDAITTAAAVVIVLSKASVESEWCKKELTAGLVRELDEKKVLVLPALLEECSIPLFLRDKRYADFRSDPDQALQDLVNALARVTTDEQNRIEDVRGHIDWSSEWTVDSAGIVAVHLVVVEQIIGQPYTILSLVDIGLNDVASRRHLDLVNGGFEPFARQLVIASLAESSVCDDLFVCMEDATAVEQRFGVEDPKAGLKLSGRAVCRRMGADTGKDLVLDLGRQLRGLAEQTLDVIRRSRVPGQAERLRQIMAKYRPGFPPLS